MIFIYNISGAAGASRKSGIKDMMEKAATALGRKRGKGRGPSAGRSVQRPQSTQAEYFPPQPLLCFHVLSSAPQGQFISLSSPLLPRIQFCCSCCFHLVICSIILCYIFLISCCNDQSRETAITITVASLCSKLRHPLREGYCKPVLL